MAIAMTAAIAPSVATIGVTTLTSPSRTPSSQQPEPTTKPTPATIAHAHSSEGALGAPSTTRASGTTAAAPIAIVQASVVRAPRMRAGRASTIAETPHSRAAVRPQATPLTPARSCGSAPSPP